MPPHGVNQQRMSGGAQLQPAVARERRLHAVDEQRESRPRLQNVDLRCRLDASLHVERTSAEGVGKRKENSANLLRFLLLERHDVVVDLDRAERLEEQARASSGAPMVGAGGRGE